jgi:PAN domain
MSIAKFLMCGLGLALGAMTLSPLEAAAQGARQSRADVRYGFCFGGGTNLVYAKAQASSVAECAQRCVDDAKCAAFEIWDHNFTCKLYNAVPRDVPRPQTVFPQNRKQDGTQAQAALGIKVTEGF